VGKARVTKERAKKRTGLRRCKWQLMSSGRETEKEEDRRVLRCSRRTRKAVVPFGGNNKDESTEAESETENTRDWDLRSLIVEPSGSDHSVEESVVGAGSELSFEKSVRGSREVNLGDLSNTARLKYQSDMQNSKEQVDRDGRSTLSHDSGLGKMPEVGMGDFFRWFAEDQKRNREDQLRREEEQRRREEESIRLQREEAARRDEESRRAIETQQKLIEAMMARTEVRDTTPSAPTVLPWRLERFQDACGRGSWCPAYPFRLW